MSMDAESPGIRPETTLSPKEIILGIEGVTAKIWHAKKSRTGAVILLPSGRCDHSNLGDPETRLLQAVAAHLALTHQVDAIVLDLPKEDDQRYSKVEAIVMRQKRIIACLEELVATTPDRPIAIFAAGISAQCTAALFTTRVPTWHSVRQLLLADWRGDKNIMAREPCLPWRVISNCQEYQCQLDALSSSPLWLGILAEGYAAQLVLPLKVSSRGVHDPSVA